MIGGCDPDGNPVYNDVTDMILDAYTDNKLINPKLNARASVRSPRKYIERLAALAMTGNNNLVVENDDYIMIEDKKLDLLPTVEEEIMLEMPSRTLCKEDCLGLCHKCGKNLNEGDCDCGKKEVDPRLAILKTLLQ
jgi:pyruvate-formate lyase